MTAAETGLEHQARSAREGAYAPYSGYQVGAALEAADGRVFTGCNVENAAYSITCCAERVALYSAVAAGVREFRQLVVSAEGPTAYPCGSCRQALAEFAPELPITIVGDRDSRRQFTLDELLPRPFTMDRGRPV